MASASFDVNVNVTLTDLAEFRELVDAASCVVHLTAPTPEIVRLQKAVCAILYPSLAPASLQSVK